MRLIDADALNGYKFGLISPYAQNLFHKTINEAPTIDYKRLLEQEPCTDAISREKALQIIRAWFDREATPSDLKNEIEQLPPVTPQYTDAEIQKMQDLEFAEIQKAYEIGKEEGSSEKPNKWIDADVLDKIRADLHATAEMHEDGDYYLREEWIDEIFDKYKASSAGAERNDKE